jgi:hypothetical protein
MEGHMIHSRILDLHGTLVLQFLLYGAYGSSV